MTALIPIVMNQLGFGRITGDRSGLGSSRSQVEKQEQQRTGNRVRFSWVQGQLFDADLCQLQGVLYTIKPRRYKR